MSSWVISRFPVVSHRPSNRASVRGIEIRNVTNVNIAITSGFKKINGFDYLLVSNKCFYLAAGKSRSRGDQDAVTEVIYYGVTV